jgi:hypothetical protein
MIFEVTADESLPFADVFENSIDLLTWEAVLTYTFGSEDGKRIYYLYKEYCSYGALDTGGETCSDELNFQQFMTDYLSLCNQRFKYFQFSNLLICVFQVNADKPNKNRFQPIYLWCIF